MWWEHHSRAGAMRHWLGWAHTQMAARGEQAQDFEQGLREENPDILLIATTSL